MIARVAVQSGIPPRDLLELDGEMFEAVLTAVEERWPPEAEIAAQAAEIAHAHLGVYVQAHSKRRVQWEPLKIDRPGDKRELPAAEAPVVSFLELAHIGGRGVRLEEVTNP